jgi:four helix bundle protein
LPTSEDYGLSNQIKRASISIPSNIAEGFGRKNTKEYIQFLYISLGSCFETETQLIIMNNIFKVDIKETSHLLTEIIKMLYALIGKLKATNH